MSISGPLTAMNTILADSLDWMASKLEGATDLNKAIQDTLKEVMDKHGRVIFNGNGYSEEWHAEAAERGLANLKTSADALPALSLPEIAEVFEKYGVLSETELKSRYAILGEQYEKVVNVEAKLVAEIAQTKIFPVAAEYAASLAEGAAKLKAAGVSVSTATLEKVAALVSQLESDLAMLHAVHSKAHEIGDWTFKVLPAMLKIRATVDELEGLLPDDVWPLPTYQEMLFIK
jgi:glutamine synthetase